MLTEFKLIECPRDAMQGISRFIPTELKIQYLSHLLSLDFDVLDCGSFVNPESVPQMADTAEVISEISKIESKTKLLVIVANERGALRAVVHPKISYLGYPFSISETFQRRNTNSTRQDAFIRLAKIQEIAMASGKEVVAYISMGFGNPYGDEYSPEITIEWAEKIASLGIRIISLADTMGVANTKDIEKTYMGLINHLPHIEFGAHFHSTPSDWLPKIESAYLAGCKRFDGAILGFGGCPFASDHLVGNIATENLIHFINKTNSNKIFSFLSEDTLNLASKVFNS
jgi:hydroxymethylglutaryl-CoA lyase